MGENLSIVIIQNSLKSERRMITSYHARANGLAEKMVHISANTINKLMNGSLTKWEYYLPSTQFFNYTKIAPTTSSNPYSLMFSRAPNFFSKRTLSQQVSEADIKKRLEFMKEVVYPSIREKLTRRTQIERKCLPETIASLSRTSSRLGLPVMALDELRLEKSSPRYTGPFKIEGEPVH